MMNNNFKNFTQKYRPSSFEELQGQTILKKSFSTAFTKGNIYHAYIFTGGSGIGKTTVARILAKMLNCKHLIQKSDLLLPCNECNDCESISNFSHPDVFEFDAASKTSVDDIREIISNAEILPITAKYKIFIIDEVHMLSKNAFNALLKIIEEPPQYVIFFLATTEINKIPQTVISRCNSYKLAKLTYLEIKDLITKISVKEEIIIQSDALELLSAKANGSGRLAVIYLEQIANYCQDNEILFSDVTSVLGVPSVDRFVLLLELIEQQNTAKALLLVKEVYLDTNNISLFLSSFADFIAELIKFKLLNNYHNILYKKYKIQILSLSSKISIEKLTILWQFFNQSAHEIGKSHNILLFLEMEIIKSIFSVSLPDISDQVELKKQIDNNLNMESFENYLAEDNFIINFTKFIHSEKDIELYHILLNNMEFSLQDKVLQVYTDLDLYDNSDSLDKKEKLQFTQLKQLFKKYCQNISVTLEMNLVKKNNVENLKTKIIQQVMHSDSNFQLLKKQFDDVKISDIILERES